MIRTSGSEPRIYARLSRPTNGLPFEKRGRPFLIHQLLVAALLDSFQSVTVFARSGLLMSAVNKRKWDVFIICTRTVYVRVEEKLSLKEERFRVG